MCPQFHHQSKVTFSNVRLVSNTAQLSHTDRSPGRINPRRELSFLITFSSCSLELRDHHADCRRSDGCCFSGR